MRIVLNGDDTDVPGPLTVQGLLDHLGVDGRLVAVECNRVVIKRARYVDTNIPENAEIEIVAFVGGGAGKKERSTENTSLRFSRRHFVLVTSYL